MFKSGLSIIVPIYNEIECLEKYLDILVTELIKSGIEFNLIFVCSGCFDGSENYLKNELKKFNINYKILIEEKRNGYGSAVKLGISEIQYMNFTIFHIDFQYTIDSIIRIYRENIDKTIITFRINNKTNFLRRIQSFFYKKICGFLFNLNFDDINSIKILETKYFSNKTKIFSDSSIIELQFLIYLKNYSINYIYAPIALYERNVGNSKNSLIYKLDMIFEMIKLKIKS